MVCLLCDFKILLTVFNQSYNCQTSHYLGRNWVPKPFLILPSLLATLHFTKSKSGSEGRSIEFSIFFILCSNLSFWLLNYNVHPTVLLLTVLLFFLEGFHNNKTPFCSNATASAGQYARGYIRSLWSKSYSSVQPCVYYLWVFSGAMA